MDQEFALPDALLAFETLREAGGFAEQRFRVPAFVGMIGDESAQPRTQGKTDAEIVTIIETPSPVRTTPEQLARFYASREARNTRGERDA